MSKLENLFLIVPSNRSISNLSDINNDTFYGTGFFISEDGLFLSVAHNFKDYKYHYLILRDQEGHCHLREIEFEKNFILDVNCDYAIGKINVYCDYLKYKTYTKEKGTGLVQGIKDRKLIGVLKYEFYTHSTVKPIELEDLPFLEEDDHSNHDNLPPKKNINDMPNHFYDILYSSEYFQNYQRTFYRNDIVFKIISFDQLFRQHETKHEFIEICCINENGEIDDFEFGETTPLSGLSGSPFIDTNGYVLGLHAGSKEDFVKREILHNYMIPITDNFHNFIEEHTKQFDEN